MPVLKSISTANCTTGSLAGVYPALSAVTGYMMSKKKLKFAMDAYFRKVVENICPLGVSIKM